MPAQPDTEIAGSHQGGEPAGPADGVHDIRPLTAPARPQRVTERGYVGQRFRVTRLPTAPTGMCTTRRPPPSPASPAELLRVHGHPVPLPGEDTGELAESGVVRTMAIFIGCLLAGGSSSRCLARETENDA